jgi:hypothetical protein
VEQLDMWDFGLVVDILLQTRSYPAIKQDNSKSHKAHFPKFLFMEKQLEKWCNISIFKKYCKKLHDGGIKYCNENEIKASKNEIDSENRLNRGLELISNNCPIGRGG